MRDYPQNYDVMVVGGGMVGAAAALGLAKNGWSVAVLEPVAPKSFDPESLPDLRISALSGRSVDLLKKLNVWGRVIAMRSAPYRRLETWEWEQAHVSFEADSISRSELGFMIENPLLQLVLWQEIERCSNVTIFCPSRLESMQKTGKTWQLTLNTKAKLKTPLVIGADGLHSKVRLWSGIGSTGWEYHQSCLLMIVKTNQPQQDVTWQQFFPSGPRAFLPLWDDWASLVYYHHPKHIQRLQRMSSSELHQHVHQNFPKKLGNVSIMATGSFPLTRHHAHSYIQAGLALIGDAAHTIHPLAGQGVNLGYRDVSALLEVLHEARSKGECWYSHQVLLRYQHQRQLDNFLMQNTIDLFYNTFSSTLLPMKLARNLALFAAERAGKLKRKVLEYALGY
ncbi:3-demethoxyubiquinol 3-hydroxylase [Candidatus Hamiltonella endosymbiont of Tuberolachnus salignus]|uniref:3-demethoxyubiquinol 3-hydroxylase n=1 Tax=Candidatus Williamhamiltonella endosymbiont of Tuberolachnus salignus TaxID=3077954 RepID=UPI0030CDB9DF